jgi:hypothetical protein
LHHTSTAGTIGHNATTAKDGGNRSRAVPKKLDQVLV